MHDGSGALGTDLAGGAVLVVVAGAAAAGASQTDHTGPLLAFGGAIIVAVIAAVTAGRRQRRVLAAERERLSDQLAHDRDIAERSLDAESSRLAQQLAHARRLIDLQHMRDVLDEAAKLYETAEYEGASLAVALRNAYAVEESYKQAIEARRAVSTMAKRLGLRFPPDHPMYRTYADVSRAVNQRVFHLRDLLTEIQSGSKPDAGESESEEQKRVITQEEDDRDTGLGVEAMQAFDTFAAAARAEIGPPQHSTDATEKLSA